MAKELAKRETRFETFDAADPNRKMALEETPWLRQSRGGDAGGDDLALLRVLDPRVARAAARRRARPSSQKAQLPAGAFPWFPGGPPSPYMTLYLLYGFATRRRVRGRGAAGDGRSAAGSYLAAATIERDWWREAIARTTAAGSS